MSTPEQRAELAGKIERLVSREFGGDYDEAFAHYDRNIDGKINRDELLKILEDANVGSDIGSGLRRRMWADGIMDEVDKNRDGMISREEFNTIIGR